MMNAAAIASVTTATVLLILKIVAYWMTGSIAILAALADSATDVFTSGVNLVAVRHALTPADHDHRFGHAKAEPLAGLLQAAFIGGSATFLVFELIDHLVSPHPLEHELIGIGVMVFSIVATFGLVWFQRYVVRRTRSVAIAADSMHYWGDLLTNLGVIVGILLSTRLGWFIADPLIGLAIAGDLERLACLPPILRPADGPRTAGRGARTDKNRSAAPSQCARHSRFPDTRGGNGELYPVAC